MRLVVPDYANPYRKEMAQMQVSPSGYEQVDEAGRAFWSEAGMNTVAELAVIYDEHVESLMEFLHFAGGRKCEFGYPFGLHEWHANDYVFEVGEERPVFILYTWHDRQFCLCQWAEVVGKSVRVFDL